MNSDVLIIGGGIIGLTIARELQARGVGRITIVDRGVLGGEASWAAAGMLAPNIEAGTPGVFHRFCCESLELYPDLAEGLRAETGIDVELDRSGTMCVAFNDAEVDELQKHVTRGAERLSGDELRGLEPLLSEDIREGLLFPNDWQVENRKLLSALRLSVEQNGAQVREQTDVSGLLVEGRKVVGAITDHDEVFAGTTVLATGAWTSVIQTGESAMPFSVRPIRGQMASFETDRRQMSRVVFSARGYLVPRSDGRVLVGASVEDVGFENETTDDAIESLRIAAIEIVPRLAGFSVAERWSGLRPFVADGLPVIGEVPGFENVLVATAHYRNGILLAPRTAQIVADNIVSGTGSKYFDAFRADRFGSTAMNVAAGI